MCRAFHGFGTEVEMRLYPSAGRSSRGAAALSAGVRWLRRAEARLSRFDPESEVSKVNRAAGRTVRLSHLTSAVIAAALDAAAATGGLFDPTVEPTMRRAGYGVSFELIAHDGTSDIAPFPGGITWRDVLLDREARTLRLPPGAGLDLGGIAKGWLAGRVLRRLAPHGAALVDIGGDIALTRAQAPGRWAIDVAAPSAPEETLGTLLVRAGSVATSGVTKRVWQTRNGPQHHIIDPRTGRPASTDLVSVTVVAPSACAAEVVAKTALLLGMEAARRAIESSGRFTAILVSADGRPALAGRLGGRVLSWEEYG